MNVHFNSQKYNATHSVLKYFLIPYISYYKGIASSTNAFCKDLSDSVSSQKLKCAAKGLKALILFKDLAKKWTPRLTPKPKKETSN